MKKILLVLIMLFSGMLIQAQTFSEAANMYLAHISSKNSSHRVKTDYGSFAARAKIKYGVITKFIIIVTNENPLYDTIMENEKDTEVKVGTMWTDFIYTAKPVKSKTFKDLSAATEYYNACHESVIDAYKSVEIYKYNKKEKFIVGLFHIEDDKYLIDWETIYGSVNKYTKIK